MIEALESAWYEGRVFCAFESREECKHYISKYYPNIDPFDVQLKTMYVSEYKPTGYFDR